MSCEAPHTSNSRDTHAPVSVPVSDGVDVLEVSCGPGNRRLPGGTRMEPSEQPTMSELQRTHEIHTHMYIHTCMHAHIYIRCLGSDSVRACQLAHSVMSLFTSASVNSMPNWRDASWISAGSTYPVPSRSNTCGAQGRALHAYGIRTVRMYGSAVAKPCVAERSGGG